MKCNWVKPIKDFYRHPGMSDGRVNKCKECNKKDVSENYSKRRSYYKEYERTRLNLPHRVQARKKYAQSETGKICGNKAKQRWAERNPIKRKASNKVNNAVRDGLLVKPKQCQECGATGRINGHHDDYAKPLSVRWLCSACHSGWHKENGEAKNAA